ncbi:putative gustatory receptor 58c [Drosophila guanche]|uniref:Gustatory receptor n=1 Tax=Drosophila guanche TaxID=7266 RepID=A0A3B0J648_DROGU|nr:putative gustatory receptor 58c [Drosophila guanche]SPP75393.1 blast:Putative gustatory receptor 58c [Drosophila guanche]
MVHVSLLRFYFELSRLIGLCNLHYDPQHRCLVRNHVPTVVYCLVLDVIYVLVMPSAFALLAGNIYGCKNLAIFGVVYSVMAQAKLFTMMLLIGSVWLRRRRIEALANDYLKLMSDFRSDLQNNCRRLCLWKVAMTSSRFIMLIQALLSSNSLVHCKRTLDRADVAPYYVASMVFAVIMELMVCYVDFTVYMIQVSGNYLISNKTERLQEMIDDVALLPKHLGRPRDMGLRQILSAWLSLWHRCQQLDDLLRQLREIFEWQMLFNLGTTYIFNIATVFRLWIYIEYAKNFHLWECLFIVFVALAHHVELMMQFSIFETTSTKWLQLREQLQNLWFVNQSQNGTGLNSEVVLSRKLEFAILYLNRQLQTRPQRVRRLHIVGLFDLSRASGHAMTASVFSNALVLCQIAYKIFG